MAIPPDIKDSIAKVKPLSQSAVRLMSIMADPDHTVAQIAAVVESDPILTGNVLRVVNSPAFGLRAKISTVARAVSYTGGNMVVGLALHLCASGIFNNPLDGYESQRGSLWRHCLFTAIASREIARFSDGKADPEVAYTAGLLHDIGKAVMSAPLGDSARKIVAIADKGEMPDFVAGEAKAVGTDHPEVGEAIAIHWSLPGPLREVIRHHHAPSKAKEEYRTLVYAVHLGDFIAMMSGTGTGADTMLYLLDHDYRNFVDISAAELEKVILDAGQEYQQVVESMFGSEEEMQ
ncbi:HDOD domain-containing protein [Desulfatibacillum aliphaticivorans]|uniref:HDOD domain-containing protein n=1 Tax=Desulfatibacillum aliphaticivorans TaxID=218208 RepID=UPI00042693A1|nr:HDOD domain-containing protein [Desulfatibacillum aliphaticivorans]